MRKIYALGLLALWAGGCASQSESLARRAAEHQARADQYASQRDYERAAVEQRKADKLYRRAQTEAQQRGELPPPPPVSPQYD